VICCLKKKQLDWLLKLFFPNGSVFKTKIFGRVQEQLQKEIVKITNETMRTCRDEEIKETSGESGLKKYREGKTVANDVKFTVSYNMGWNKRSSGRKYDSISGHGFLMGGHTKNNIHHRCLSKCCSKCAKESKDKAPEHKCHKNHDGSSKSMETEAIFRMVLETKREQNYTISTIISDDD
jgi:putative lipoic acid-binding regulatory protein